MIGNNHLTSEGTSPHHQKLFFWWWWIHTFNVAVCLCILYRADKHYLSVFPLSSIAWSKSSSVSRCPCLSCLLWILHCLHCEWRQQQSFCPATKLTMAPRSTRAYSRPHSSPLRRDSQTHRASWERALNKQIKGRLNVRPANTRPTDKRGFFDSLQLCHFPRERRRDPYDAHTHYRSLSNSIIGPGIRVG